jgi:GT2 family glycosyltransferase
MKYIVVTNTVNRDVALVVRCLRSSLNQKIRPQRVILIDQNSPNLNLPEDLFSNPLIEVHKVDYKSVSEARNSIKIPQATEWIVFCDDDGYLFENYSDEMQRIINSYPDLQIIAGSIIREDNNDFYTLRHKKGGSLKYFRYTKNLMGSNLIVNTSSFDSLGRFDRNFGAGSYWGSSEETDFCWKAYFNNIEMEFFPELKVIHVPPFSESISTGFQKAFRYGIGKGALVFKWLVLKKKFVVFYELAEMLVVPFYLSLRGIILLKPQIVLTNFAAIAGRVYGFFRAIFLRQQFL